MSRPIFGAVEAGGTKFNLAVGHSLDFLRTATLSTRAPRETLEDCAAFFRDCRDEFGPIAGIGIATFGPVNLHADSPGYGRLLGTPKPGWADAPVGGHLAGALDCPVAIDTDVNAAALAEHSRLNPKGNTAYVTVGTGVGVGVCLGGETLRGELHPELGHLPVALREGEPPGQCPYHPLCVEGLICGPALKGRWGVATEDAAPDHPLWDSAAHYLAQLCAAITMAYSPQKILIGGGVAGAHENLLLEKTREPFLAALGGYLPEEALPGGGNVIAPPHWKDAGLAGAFMLAQKRL